MRQLIKVNMAVVKDDTHELYEVIDFNSKYVTVRMYRSDKETTWSMNEFNNRFTYYDFINFKNGGTK
jgi:hypothetical protein